ncbi:MAG TPA: hypothetical protein VH702_19385 [Vicinamibacterales bacterium]|jgi:hypothetical protein
MSPIWRNPKESKPKTPEQVARERAIVEELKGIKDAPEATGDVRIKDAAFVMLKSVIPARLGKWQIVPPEAVRSSASDD